MQSNVKHVHQITKRIIIRKKSYFPSNGEYEKAEVSSLKKRKHKKFEDLM